MKRLSMYRIYPAMALILIVRTCFALSEPFSPTLLKLQCDPIVQYDFTGENIDIPILVEGTPAGVVFCLFTRDRAWNINGVTNGYLGWHYVNKIDTCIYHSQMYSLDPGPQTIPWDGRDQEGSYLPVGEYTYYLWGFDNKSERQLVTKIMHIGGWFDYTSTVQEVDESGLPRVNPIWYRSNERWLIGGDPADSSAYITTDLTDVLAGGWTGLGEPLLEYSDFNYQYLMAADKTNRLGSIVKYRFVPNGRAEIITDWGTNGFAETFETAGGGSAGVVSDGIFLYITDENHVTSSEPDADFYVYDVDGNMVRRIDLTSWWSSSDDYSRGGQMNGGPNNFYHRNGNIFLNCHCNCLVQMVNPIRYLETEESGEFIAWSNGNGDYVLDHNFEETAYLPWVCNDYNVGAYKFSVGADANLFTLVTAYDVGAVTFGLLAPDGTGLGHFAFAGETAGYKRGLLVVDGATPFDGLYCDYPVMPSYHFGSPPEREQQLFYIASDSVKGVIKSYADCFSSDAVLTLVSPNGGESFTAGSTVAIDWSVTNGCNMPVFLRAEYSADNGVTWHVAVEYMKTYGKSAQWNIPAAVSGTCLLRLVDSYSGAVHDASDAPFSIVPGVAVEEAVPLSFSLSQNTPNPFNPRTTIAFSLPEECRVTLTVYTITGAKAATLVDSVLSAGTHEAQWDASDFPSGVYLCRLVAGGHSKTVKMTLVR